MCLLACFPFFPLTHLSPNLRMLSLLLVFIPFSYHVLSILLSIVLTLNPKWSADWLLTTSHPFPVKTDCQSPVSSYRSYQSQRMLLLYTVAKGGHCVYVNMCVCMCVSVSVSVSCLRASRIPHVGWTSCCCCCSSYQSASVKGELL